MQHGLIPSGAFVCLSEYPDSWFEDYALLSVDIERFMDDFPGIDVRTWQPELDEICVWGSIPPEYISKEE